MALDLRRLLVHVVYCLVIVMFTGCGGDDETPGESGAPFAPSTAGIEPSPPGNDDSGNNPNPGPVTNPPTDPGTHPGSHPNPGDGNSNGGTAPPPSAATPLTYMFYLADAITAVDPVDINNTSKRVTIRASVVNSELRMLRYGKYDAATETVLGIHPRALVYAAADERLYRLNALTSAPASAVRISSENTAGLICPGMRIATDFADFDQSQIVYALPGPDESCESGDETWKMVRVSMPATVAPVAAKQPVSALLQPGAGGIAGWLTHDNGNLIRCDANFANCGNSLAVVDTQVMLRLALNQIQTRLLDIDGELHIFRGDTLSPSLFTTPVDTALSSFTSDDTHVYFANGALIYRLPINGGQAAAELVTAPSEVSRIELTSNNVIYSTGAQIFSVAKSGGTPLILIDAVDKDAGLWGTAGPLVYYNVSAFTESGTQAASAAGVINEDGSNKLERSLAAWIGSVSPSVLDLRKGGRAANHADMMILAEGYDATGPDGFSGAALFAYNAALGTQTAALGLLPDNSNLDFLSCSGIAPYVLCNATNADAPQTDVFYLEATRDSSLTRVTSTSAVDEFILNYDERFF